MPRILATLWKRLDLSPPCLLPAAVFLAASLLPSLLPRPPVLQGVLSGLSFAIGYGLGAFLLLLLSFFGWKGWSGTIARRGFAVAGSMAVALVAASLWHAARWQNSIREMIGLEPRAGMSPLIVLLTAVLVFLLVLLLARGFRWLRLRASRWLARYVPQRVSIVAGAAAAAVVFWFAINGFLYGFILKTVDRSFQRLDAFIDADTPPPAMATCTGSTASLVNWEDLGRQGRAFISGGPNAAELTAFFGTPLEDPIRVYVGLNSAETPEKRARLALEELKRVGGFERAILLVVTPTGTGWVDPSGQEPVEYLHRGDIATVAVQYSYLSSPLALMTDAEYGAETARALFHEIYGHWRTLPRDSRPKLYLNGLSLGSLNSDLSFDFYDIIDDPFQGALWSGPPFRHETWRVVTARRDAGSPAWLPNFRSGSVVRFMNQDGVTGGNGEAWGRFRILFLQHPSDPIVFFDPTAAFTVPDWMNGPRGPDVSPRLQWFPLVTMLQLAVDMLVGSAPKGYGHNYAAADYLAAWVALTEPTGWGEPDLARLRTLLTERENRRK